MTRTVEMIAREWFPFFAQIVEMPGNTDDEGQVRWSFVDADFTFNTVGNSEIEENYNELFDRLCEMAKEHPSLPMAR